MNVIEIAAPAARVPIERPTLAVRLRDVEGSQPDWDEFVRTSGGDILQTSMWALYLRERGQQSIIVELRDGGEIVAGALLVLRRFGPGLRSGYVARGPVVAPNAPSSLPHAVDAVLEAARGLGLAVLMVQSTHLATRKILGVRGFHAGAPSVAPDATARLDLRRSDDELLAAMGSSRKRDIRKAEREPIEIAETDDVETFHRLHKAVASRRGFVAPSLGELEAQWRALAPAGAASILLAKWNGRPIAAKWQTQFGGVVTARLTGWDAEANRRLHANVALHWAAIRRARERGAAFYDFGGFDRANARLLLSGQEPPESFRGTPAFFKLAFGATPVVYPRSQFVILNRFANGVVGPMVPWLLRSRAGAAAVRRLKRTARAAGHLFRPA